VTHRTRVLGSGPKRTLRVRERVGSGVERGLWSRDWHATMPAVNVTSTHGVRSNAVWSVLDQIASSASNALLPLVSLALLPTVGAGRLSIVLSFVFFALGVSRGVLGETILLTRRAAGEGARGEVHGEMLGAALAVGLFLGVPIAVVAATLARAGWLSVGIGLGFSAVVVQDTIRYTFFARMQAHRALINDLAWLGSFVVFLAAWRPTRSPGFLLLEWVAAASLAALLGGFQLHAHPRLGAASRVLRGYASVGVKIGSEFLVVAGLPQALIAVVGLRGSLDGAAAYRLATTLLTPAGVVVTGMITALQPLCVRDASDPDRLRRYFVRAALVGIFAVIACLLAVWAMPVGVGRRLLGASYPLGRALCLPLGVAGVFQSTSAAANLVVRARERVVDALRIRIVFGGLGLAAVLAMPRSGATAVAWTYTICSVLVLAGLLLSPALRFRSSVR
jgi:hypothetical protein